MRDKETAIADELREIADAIEEDNVSYTYNSEFNRQNLRESIELDLNWG